MDWCADKKGMTRERGIFLGKQLVSRRFGVNVEAEVDFRVSERGNENALFRVKNEFEVAAGLTVS